MSERRRGFTLMEMVLAIVVLGIIGASFGAFIVPAIQGHQAVEKRAALVDSAEIALRRMARDIRIAVPNSVRVTNAANGFMLEMVPTVDGGRYCLSGLVDCGSLVGGLSPVDRQTLEIGSGDTQFDIIGFFQDSGFTTTPSSYRLAVGNTGSAIYTDSANPGVITPAGGSISLSTDVDRHHVTLGSSFQFSNPSPRQRIFVVKTAEAPVAYICDKTLHTLTRYWNYSFTAAPTSGTSALVTNNVNDCSISTDTTTVQTQGYVTLTVKLINAGETVELAMRAQLDNSQ